MSGMFYLANQAEVKASHLVQRSSAAAGAINGTGVDLANYVGPVLIHVNAPVASASDTINFTVEHSEDNSSYSAVPASELVNPDTGAAATFTQVTAAAAVNETLALKRERLKRYIRVVATTAGSGIDVTFAAYVIGEKRVY
jgi:hypothetical protein